MKRTIRQTVFPILTAFIWGTAFTAQSVGADYVGPLTFNALRSLIAFFALLVLDLAAARLIPAAGACSSSLERSAGPSSSAAAPAG